MCTLRDSYGKCKGRCLITLHHTSLRPQPWQRNLTQRRQVVIVQQLDPVSLRLRVTPRRQVSRLCPCCCPVWGPRLERTSSIWASANEAALRLCGQEIYAPWPIDATVLQPYGKLVGTQGATPSRTGSICEQRPYEDCCKTSLLTHCVSQVRCWEVAADRACGEGTAQARSTWIAALRTDLRAACRYL